MPGGKPGPVVPGKILHVRREIAVSGWQGVLGTPVQTAPQHHCVGHSCYMICSPSCLQLVGMQRCHSCNLLVTCNIQLSACLKISRLIIACQGVKVLYAYANLACSVERELADMQICCCLSMWHLRRTPDALRHQSSAVGVSARPAYMQKASNSDICVQQSTQRDKFLCRCMQCICNTIAALNHVQHNGTASRPSTDSAFANALTIMLASTGMLLGSLRPSTMVLGSARTHALGWTDHSVFNQFLRSLSPARCTLIAAERVPNHSASWPKHSRLW